MRAPGVTRPGRAQALPQLVGPWWRMGGPVDRVAESRPVAGCALADPATAQQGGWRHVYDRTVADDRAFGPRAVEEELGDRRAQLPSIRLVGEESCLAVRI